MRAQVKINQQPASGIDLLILGTDSQYRADCEARDTASGMINSGGKGDESKKFLPHPRGPAVLPLDELVSILPRVSSLFKRAAFALKPQSIRYETQLKPLRQDAIAVRSELLAWCSL